MQKTRNVILTILLILNIGSWILVIPRQLARYKLISIDIKLFTQYNVIESSMFLIGSLIFTILLIIVVILNFILQKNKKRINL